MTADGLRDFQERFARGLLETPPGAPDPRWGAGYDIHVRNVRNSLVAALGQAFMVTSRLVGPDFFAQMARAFVTRSPPRHGWLTAYGAGFPAFVDHYGAASALPYLADVARLEWARIRAAYGDDMPGLDLRRLATLPPSDLLERRVDLHPCATIIRSPFPIHRIWASHQGTADGELDQEIALDLGRDDVLVARDASGEAMVISLLPGAAAFLAALEKRRSLGMAWNSALDADPAFDLAATLADMSAYRALGA